MRKKSILKQLLIPMLTIAIALPVVVLVIFTTSYEREIYSKNKQLSGLMADEIEIFMDQAYAVKRGACGQSKHYDDGYGCTDTYFKAVCREKLLFGSDLHTRYGRHTDGAFDRGTGRSFGEMVVYKNDGRSAGFYIQVLLFCRDRNALCIRILSNVWK